jgi:hypothetical protein
MAGCGGSQETEKTKALTVDQQIQRIQSDPNTPPEAKAAMVQQLQAQTGAATAKQSLLPKK